MIYKNTEVRNQAKAANVPLWAIAERMGISEPTMTRKMRHELPENERLSMMNIIADIIREREDRADENADNR